MKTSFLTIGTIVWLFCGSLILILEPDLNFLIFALLYLLSFLFGIVLFIIAVSHIRRFRLRALVYILIILAGFGTFIEGKILAERIRFAFVRSSYEARLHEILDKSKGTSIGKNIDYKIDNGSPVRVAFVWEGGIIDNWVGLVYDPSGEVMKANQFKGDWSNWNDPKLRKIKSLFGGDIQRTHHLSGDWYLCFFT
jgi:hypothetical protein